MNVKIGSGRKSRGHAFLKKFQSKLYPMPYISQKNQETKFNKKKLQFEHLKKKSSKLTNELYEKSLRRN